MLLGNWLLPAVEHTPPGMTCAVGTCTGVLYVLRAAPSATAAEHARVRAVQSAAGCDALAAVGVVYDAAHWCPLCVDAAAAGAPGALDAADGRLVELHGAAVVRADEERALVTAARVAVLAPDVLPRPRDLCSVEGALRQRCVEAAARWGAQTDGARLLAAPFAPVAWPDDCVPSPEQQRLLAAQQQHRTAPPFHIDPVPSPPSPKPETPPPETPPKPAKRPHRQSPQKQAQRPKKTRPMVMSPLSWLQPVAKPEQK